MKSKSQAGFSVIEALLIIIALTLIVFVGYYVKNSNNKATKLTELGASKTQPTQNNQPTVKYLKIEQLGIKLKLNGDLTDLEYAADKTGANKVATLSSKKFTENVKACNSGSAQQYPFATLTRYEGQYDPNATPQDFFAEFSKQYDDFYITIGNPDGGFCRDFESAAAKQAKTNIDNILNSLRAAAKNAEAL